MPEKVIGRKLQSTTVGNVLENLPECFKLPQNSPSNKETCCKKVNVMIIRVILRTSDWNLIWKDWTVLKEKGNQKK